MSACAGKRELAVLFENEPRLVVDAVRSYGRPSGGQLVFGSVTRYKVRNDTTPSGQRDKPILQAGCLLESIYDVAATTLVSQVGNPPPTYRTDEVRSDDDDDDLRHRPKD
jgi:hypothetical protein